MGIYYTLRKAGDPEKPLFELTKWDPDYVRPLDVYVQWIPLAHSGYRLHSCNCPSRSNPCKHEEISLALLARGLDELPYVYYDSELGKVEQTHDAAHPHEMLRYLQE